MSRTSFKNLTLRAGRKRRYWRLRKDWSSALRAGGIRTSSIRTGFLVSGLAGLIFGTAFYLFMLATKAPGTSTNPGFLLIPVACGLIAGAAGAGGAYLDALLEKRGMASPGKRRLVSFLVVTLSTLVLFLSVAIRLELVEILGTRVRRQFLDSRVLPLANSTESACP